MASAPDLRPSPPGGPPGGPPSIPSAEIGERLQAIAAAAAAPEDAFEPGLAAVVEMSGAGGGALCLYDQRQELLRLAAEVGLSDEGCRRLRSVRRGDAAGWDMPLHGLQNRRAYLIDSAAKNRYVPPLCDANVRTIACLPLYSGSMPLGSLVLVAVAPRAFSERDIRALEPAVKELSKMIEAVRRRAQGGRAGATADGGPPSHPRTAEGRPPSESERIELLIASLAATERERARLAAALAAVDEANAARSEETTLERLSDGLPVGDEAEIERLTGRLAEAEGALAAERSRVSEWERKHGEAVRELETVRRAPTAAPGGGAATRELEQAIAAARAAEAARATAVAGAEEAKAAKAAAETLAQGLREGTARAQQEIERLEVELQTALSRRDDAASSLLAGLERELASVREENVRLLATTAEQDAERAGLAARLETAAAEGERLRATAAAVEAERDGLREAIAAAESGRQEAQSALAAAEAERDRLHKSEETATRERDELRATVEGLEAECARLREGQTGVESELTQARTALEEAREALAVAEANRAQAFPAPVEQSESVAAFVGQAGTTPEPEAPVLVADAPKPEPGPKTKSAPAPSAAAAASPTPSPVAAGGKPTIVVVDVDGVWEGATVNGHRVALLGPGADLGDKLQAIGAARVVANLAAPGTLDALATLRASGSRVRVWGCIAAPGVAKALPLALIEPAVQPVDPDAVVGALGSYTPRGTRVVTIGSDVDVLVTLRQAMARQGMSVSMAWDAKQAADLLVMVKPQLVVVDLGLPRDGYSIVANLSGIEPVPNLVLIRGRVDPAAGFGTALNELAVRQRVIPRERLLTNVLRANEGGAAEKNEKK